MSLIKKKEKLPNFGDLYMSTKEVSELTGIAVSTIHGRKGAARDFKRLYFDGKKETFYRRDEIEKFERERREKAERDARRKS